MSDITAMIQALGYPVCVSVALFFALVKIFGLYLRVASNLTEATRTHAEKMEAVSHASNQALAANTTSNRRLVEAIESKLPTVCRAEDFIRALREPTT